MPPVSSNVTVNISSHSDCPRMSALTFPRLLLCAASGIRVSDGAVLSRYGQQAVGNGVTHLHWASSEDNAEDAVCNNATQPRSPPQRTGSAGVLTASF